MKLLQFFIKALTLFSLFITVAFAATSETEQEKKEQQKFIELLPKDFKPAFTRETVIKLNAIVHRSYDVISEYDTIIEQTLHDLKQASHKNATQQFKLATKQKVVQIQKLEERSTFALSDMMDAVKILRNSDEEYNKAILAGMVDFVKDVQQEITRKNAELTTMLKNT